MINDLIHLQGKVDVLLTSRERCARSILLEEPDRIPLSLNIRPEPYEQLMAALGVSEKGVKGHIEVVKSLGVDIIGLGLGLRGGYLQPMLRERRVPMGLHIRSASGKASKSEKTFGASTAFGRRITPTHSPMSPIH